MEAGQRDKIFKINDWTGYDLTTELEDGTSLFSYIAESSGQKSAATTTADKGAEAGDGDEGDGANVNTAETGAEHNLVMRITFLPRFKCSPLIEIFGTLPENTSAAARVASIKNFNKLSVSIDDEQFEFPAVVEERGNEIHSFLNASLQRRTSVRILVELGNSAIVTFGDNTQTRISLIGSRDTIGQALGRCRNHQ